MSKIETLAGDAPEYLALSDADWDAWRALPQTRRLATWLQELVAQRQAWIEKSRARAAKLIGEQEDDVEYENRQVRGLRGEAFAFGHALEAIELTSATSIAEQARKLAEIETMCRARSEKVEAA